LISEGNTLIPKNSWRIIPNSQNLTKMQAVLYENLIFTPKKTHWTFLHSVFPPLAAESAPLPQAAKKPRPKCCGQTLNCRKNAVWRLFVAALAPCRKR
jgi:hypothetical protein